MIACNKEKKFRSLDCSSLLMNYDLPLTPIRRMLMLGLKRIAHHLEKSKPSTSCMEVSGASREDGLFEDGTQTRDQSGTWATAARSSCFTSCGSSSSAMVNFDNVCRA